MVVKLFMVHKDTYVEVIVNYVFVKTKQYNFISLWDSFVKFISKLVTAYLSLTDILYRQF